MARTIAMVLQSPGPRITAFQVDTRNSGTCATSIPCWPRSRRGVAMQVWELRADHLMHLADIEHKPETALAEEPA